MGHILDTEDLVILLVDPIEIRREKVAAALESQGCEIVFASHESDACRAIQMFQVSMVLINMDVEVPNLFATLKTQGIPTVYADLEALSS